jgi:hypothetical protein
MCSNHCFNELSHIHRHKVPFAIMILIPEGDRFSIVSVQIVVFAIRSDA